MKPTPPPSDRPPVRLTSAKPAKLAKTAKLSRSSVRVIGGSCRGRRVEFWAEADLRPTGDRIRETLFNWLAPMLNGSTVLDAFAGTGVLGIEALSRGAKTATFIEYSAKQVSQIEATLRLFGLSGYRVVCDDALKFLERPATPVDVLFLDPPFRLNNAGLLCTLVCERGWLKPGGYVYLERPKSSLAVTLPSTLTQHRQLQAGTVDASLWRYTPSTGEQS